jgi:hypothetical protein
MNSFVKTSSQFNTPGRRSSGAVPAPQDNSPRTEVHFRNRQKNEMRPESRPGMNPGNESRLPLTPGLTSFAEWHALY